MGPLRLVLSISMLVIIWGCNTVAYHHSERISIATIETKATDPVAPIQGTIGLRTRTVLVSPGRKNDQIRIDGDPAKEGKDKTTQNNSGQCANVISDFNLQKDGLLEPTIIESALVTGTAAQNLPVATAEAIFGIGFGEVNKMSDARRDLLRKVYDLLKNIQLNPKATKIREALDDLSKRLPDISTNRYYKKEAPGKDDKRYSASGKYNLSKNSFSDVLDYDRFLSSQLVIIDEMMKDCSTILDGKKINEEKIAQLKIDLKRIQNERNDFYREIGRDPIINEALYFVSTYL